jgi:hypothetical protein
MSGARADRNFIGMSDDTAGRLARLERERPRLYASRHLAKGVGRVLLAVIGIGLFFALPLPTFDLPSIPFPDLPSVDLPHWVHVVVNVSKFVVPIVIGLLLAARELDKRRERSTEAGEH